MPATLPQSNLKSDDGSHVWDHVSHSPLHNLWDFQGASPKLVAKRTFDAFMRDNLLSRAAELGYYFLFALFPTLVSASAILGIVARSATNISTGLLEYLAVVVPASAYNLVLETFNQTTAHSSAGKIGFGLAAALWSASVGFAAIQSTLNTVYKVEETRPYWKAKGSAILVTVLLSAIVIATLGALLLGTVVAHFVRARIADPQVAWTAAFAAHIAGDILASALLVLLFAVIYYFAPDLKHKVWHWLTPGAAIGILGWLLASFALRIYLHYFDNYSVTYGSLGAVIVLLTWFYITGLMLLLGAEVNSEIAHTVTEAKLAAAPTPSLTK